MEQKGDTRNESDLCHQANMTSVYNPLRLIAWPMGIEHGGIGAHCLLNESWPLVAPTPIPPQ